ncbi:hypothetical protein GGI42DRAFT_135372 [Trichoderma sp. SZMC 28013]
MRPCRLLFRIDPAALQRAIPLPNRLPSHLIPIDIQSDENTDAGTGFEAQRRPLRTYIRRWRSGQKLHPSLHDLSITVRFAASILGGEDGREKKEEEKNYIPDCATPSSKPFFFFSCSAYIITIVFVFNFRLDVELSYNSPTNSPVEYPVYPHVLNSAPKFGETWRRLHSTPEHLTQLAWLLFPSTLPRDSRSSSENITLLPLSSFLLNTHRGDLLDGEYTVVRGASEAYSEAV